MSPAFRVLALVAGLACLSGCGPSGDTGLLAASWASYRKTFITADGRVVRPEHGGDTVSEGQGYALLRAAWMNDRSTFDRVWQWTRSHLVRTGRPWPELLAWHWSPEAGVVDWNPATDADADVAMALVIAAARWPDATPYGDAARAVLSDLIEHATAVDDQGVSVFVPGRWADQRADGRGIVLNPSYFAPAWFRVFHRFTGDARWLQLVDGTYAVLDATCAGAPSGLPPDWIRWQGGGRWTPDEGDRGLPGWDAVRVSWRIATDDAWSAEPRARAYLDRCIEPRVRARLDVGLPVEYGAGGEPRGTADHPLANALFAFALSRAAERDRLLARVERQLMRRGSDAYFGDRDHYYVNSLAYLPFLARAGGHRAP